MTIDRDVMEVLNKCFCRKRMMSIYFLIKKFLQEMGYKNCKVLDLKISDQTLEKYNKWWNYYKKHHS